MTSAATAATIHVLCDGTITSAIVIPFRFEIIRMTGSAERFVLGRGPGNNAACSSAVAAATAWIPSVRAWIVRRSMAEAGRCPAVGGMTYFALFSRV